MLGSNDRQENVYQKNLNFEPLGPQPLFKRSQTFSATGTEPEYAWSQVLILEGSPKYYMLQKGGM
jgi:hypothetical protein